MTNKEIATVFNQLGKIMELHGENPFKIRSYYNAYNTLRKIEKPLFSMDPTELSGIKGVGKAISDKIMELAATGKLNTYEKYAEKTPAGVIEMLEVRGFGPKKVGIIWKELGIESIGELIYAIQENRLLDLKGFGLKTQNQLKNELQYFLDSKGKFLLSQAEIIAQSVRQKMYDVFPNDRHELCGLIHRKMPVVNSIEILTTTPIERILSASDKMQCEMVHNVLSYKGIALEFYHASHEEFGMQWLKSSASQEFLDEIVFQKGVMTEEEDVFNAAGIPYILPELREFPEVISKVKDGSLEKLITINDLRGVIHVHTTFSDGIHTVVEMALAARDAGYEYIVITDHSKSAFYANGLEESRIWEQFEEIDRVNAKMENFKIFKGIEADILPDGSMDYNDDILASFDMVIASIHSILKMDKAKATSRLISAIEHLHTHMLGHPTGRLLLSREGYPIDHMKVIDACAENGMVIELNANPLRMDLDWTWIPYAIEKGVMISINPDSHNKDSFHYMEYGVNAARKGLLTTPACLNAKNLFDFEKWIASIKK